MTWVAVAIGGGAVLNYLGSQSASNKASDAANAANQANQNQYDQTRQDMTPWRNAGGASMNMLAYLMGLPGYQSGPQGPYSKPNKTMEEILAGMGGGNNIFSNTANKAIAEQLFNDPSNWTTSQNGPTGLGFGQLTQNFDASKFQQDTGYAFRLAEGQKALERSAAARGMSLSGAQLKALTNYNQGFASNEYNNAYGRYNNDQTNLFNRLSGIAGTGQQANQYMGQLGANMANQFGQNTMGAATVGANATMNGYGGLQNAANQWMNYNNWNSMQNNGYGNQGGSWGGVQWTPGGNPYSPTH